jgi:hypothetical protein
VAPVAPVVPPGDEVRRGGEHEEEQRGGGAAAGRGEASHWIRRVGAGDTKSRARVSAGKSGGIAGVPRTSFRQFPKTSETTSKILSLSLSWSCRGIDDPRHVHIWRSVNPDC